VYFFRTFARFTTPITMPSIMTIDDKKVISYKRIFAIAFPIILSQLSQNIIAIADTMFLGNIGEAELAAGALGTIFYQVFFMFLWGFGVGTQITVARLKGEKKEKSIGRFFQQSVLFMFLAAILLLILYHIWGRQLLGLLVSSPEVLETSMRYIDARVWGFPFAFISASFMAFYIGISRTRIISWVAITMGVVNILGDWMLIYGKAGFPEMGIAGAAWASVFSEIVGVVVFFIISLKKENNLRYRLYKRFPIHITIIGRLLKVSYPTMFQFLISFGNYFFFFTLIESMGQHSLAIANIARSCYTVFLVPIWGFTSTVASLTAYFLGRERVENIPSTRLINKLIVRSLILGCSCVAVVVLPFFIFSDTLLGLFTNDISLVKDAFNPVLIMMSASFLVCISQIFFNVIIGHEKTKQGFIIEVVTTAVYILYSLYVIKVLHSSVTIAWTNEYIYCGCILLFSTTYLWWLRHRRVRQSL
jgi:putative MATE family efflux protein